MNLSDCFQKFIIIAIRNCIPKSENIVNITTQNKFSSGIRILSAVVLLAVITAGCGSGGQQKLDETPTRGNIRILVDESFQPLIDTEAVSYTHLTLPTIYSV